MYFPRPASDRCAVLRVHAHCNIPKRRKPQFSSVRGIVYTRGCFIALQMQLLMHVLMDNYPCVNEQLPHVLMDYYPCVNGQLPIC